jgi:hypothetical protein
MATREKIAVPLEGVPSVVLLNNGERMTRKAAIAAGYKIYGEPDATAPDDGNAATLKAHKAWRSSVLALPEARDRESAAVEIVTTHTADTMTVANARAFLRGLPTEQTQEETTTMTTDTDTNANPERAARLAEINGGMQAFNKQRGYGARTDAPASQSRGASLAGVDQTKLRRLSQIRLNALESGTAHEASAGETKKLRYALSVTGMALSDVFTQLNVDTSRLSI